MCQELLKPLLQMKLKKAQGRMVHLELQQMLQQRQNNRDRRMRWFDDEDNGFEKTHRFFINYCTSISTHILVKKKNIISCLRPHPFPFHVIYYHNKPHYLFIFYKNKRYSFIQIDRVHRYNINSNSLKTKKMKLWTNSQHPC